MNILKIRERFALLLIILNIVGISKARFCDISNLLIQPGAYLVFNPREGDRGLVQALYYQCTAYKGFDDEKNNVPLAEAAFGKPFTISDIYLASKLSNQGKLTLPGGGFGSQANQQYLSLLATTSVNLKADEREIGINLNGVYYFDIPCAPCVYGLVGFMLPIRSRRQTIEHQLIGGSLFEHSFSSTGQLPIENTLTQFFSDYTGVEDFFHRCVLEPKDLTLCTKQYRTGLGDVSVLGALDLGQNWCATEALYVGFNAVFPTAKTFNGPLVGQPDLSEGGGYHLDPFINAYFMSRYSFFNPEIYAGFRISFSHKATRRVPQLKNQLNQVLLPSRFANFQLASPFSEFDSTVAQFSDQALRVTINPGSTFILRLSNTFYCVLGTPFNFSVFYLLFAKQRDGISVADKAGIFDTDLLEKRTRQTVHTLQWSLSYKYEDEVRLYFGSQHVVAGRNAAQYHKFFASASLYF